MNKKIIFVVVALGLISVLGLWFFIPNNNEIKNENSSVKSEGYYIEKGVEEPAKTARSAVEAFASQDSLESSPQRNNRLTKYFTADSPVYEYGQENISSTTKKSVARVTSVKSCDEQEGEGLCLIVKASITFYSTDDSEITNSVSYWVDARSIDDQYKVYDLGVWND